MRIRGYLDDISRLKRLVPANAALMAEELDPATRDRQRAQALMEEFTVRSYDWETKQVLKKLLNANTKVIKFERMLKDTKTQPNQIEFRKELLNAEVDANKYMNLYKPTHQTAAEIALYGYTLRRHATSVRMDKTDLYLVSTKRRMGISCVS